jgi:hypothetical protein
MRRMTVPDDECVNFCRITTGNMVGNPSRLEGWGRVRSGASRIVSGRCCEWIRRSMSQRGASRQRWVEKALRGVEGLMVFMIVGLQSPACVIQREAGPSARRRRRPQVRQGPGERLPLSRRCRNPEVKRGARPCGADRKVTAGNGWISQCARRHGLSRPLRAARTLRPMARVVVLTVDVANAAKLVGSS